MEKWYPRLADVPGVGFEGGAAVDRTRLPGHDAKPRIVRRTSESKHEISDVEDERRRGFSRPGESVGDKAACR